MSTLYLAGPMTGIKQFNFPLFHKAADVLREQGYDIISPAEMDAESDVAEKAMASHSGDLLDASIKETWGDLLSRDVKIIADVVKGIVFLPGWQQSKGARLEAYVALICGHTEFYLYDERDEAAFRINIEFVKRGVINGLAK